MNTLRYSLDGCTCLFRGEGNQNLVVALKEKELVIRFRKEAKETSYDHQELEKRYLLESQYQFLIMAPLIKEYISLPLIINLPHAQVDELNTSLLICRSESRKHKEIKSNIAEIYPDYTVSFNHFQRNLLETAMSVEDSSQPKIRDYIQQLFCKSSKTFINNLLEESHLGQGVTRMVTRMFNILNGKPIPISSKEEVVFCFEIKPKQAWFPPSDRKFHKCTYCMQQYLKLKEKKIDEISNYCPLDLFSGDLKRMEYAVKNLLQSPQNNFKIFKDGMLLFGSDINNEDYISLLKEFFSYNSDNLEDEDRLISEFCYFISSALLSQVENLDEYMKEITSTTFERSFRCNIDPKLIENINENFAPCNRKFDYLPKCCILNRLLEMQMLDREGIEASYECYL